MNVYIEYYPNPFDLDEYIVKMIRDVEKIRYCKIGEKPVVEFRKDGETTFGPWAYTIKKLEVTNE